MLVVSKTRIEVTVEVMVSERTTCVELVVTETDRLLLVYVVVLVVVEEEVSVVGTTMVWIVVTLVVVVIVEVTYTVAGSGGEGVVGVTQRTFVSVPETGQSAGQHV